MIKIPFKINVDDTKFNDNASLVAFKTPLGDVYIYSFITKQFKKVGEKYFYSSFMFHGSYFYNFESDKIRVYRQKRLKYCSSIHYYGLNMRILSSSIFKLCLNGRTNVLLTTNKGKIIRKFLTIDPVFSGMRYQILNEFKNKIMICSNYIDSELNLLSYDLYNGSISKIKQLAIDMINISFYGDITIRAHYDDNFEKNLQIFRDEQLILNYYYDGKKCITSDDHIYETFYEPGSQLIEFYNYSTLSFEKPYVTKNPIRYAKRLNGTKLVIIYNDELQIIDL